MNILKVKNLGKSFNWIKAIDNLNLIIKTWEIIWLIWSNWSWKSTFFNLLTNILNKDCWTKIFNWIDITNKKTFDIANLWVIRTFQDSMALKQITVKENLDIWFKYSKKLTLKNVFLNWKYLKEEQLSHMTKIKEMLEEVWIEEKFNSLAKDLSYWQWKLLEILKVFASDSKLILLDEPFSGLFPEMIKLIKWLIEKLSKKWKTIILVEHNMNLISEICTRVIVLDAWKAIAKWSFNEIKKQEIVIESYLWK